MKIKITEQQLTEMIEMSVKKMLQEMRSETYLDAGLEAEKRGRIKQHMNFLDNTNKIPDLLDYCNNNIVYRLDDDSYAVIYYDLSGTIYYDKESFKNDVGLEYKTIFSTNTTIHDSFKVSEPRLAKTIVHWISKVTNESVDWHLFLN